THSVRPREGGARKAVRGAPPAGGAVAAPTHSSIRQVTETEGHPTFVDLFSGAGGFTAGLVFAGLKPIFAVESSGAAASTYRYNFGEHVVADEIQKVEEFPAADVVVGGPPCQGFSLLGTRSADDDRNDLWRHFWRAVRAI